MELGRKNRAIQFLVNLFKQQVPEEDVAAATKEYLNVDAFLRNLLENDEDVKKALHENIKKWLLAQINDPNKLSSLISNFDFNSLVSGMIEKDQELKDLLLTKIKDEMIVLLKEAEDLSDIFSDFDMQECLDENVDVDEFVKNIMSNKDHEIFQLIEKLLINTLKERLEE